MFLKQGKLFSTKLSIAQRLAFHYTAASAFILLLISVSLTFMLIKLFTTAEKQYLIDEQAIIVHTLQEHPGDLSAIKQEVMGVPAGLKNSSYFYFIRLRDKQHILMQTPYFETHLRGAIFFSEIGRIRKKSILFQKWTSQDGKPYLLMTAPVQQDSAGNVVKYMEMALDVSYPKMLIAKTIKYIAFFFIIFLLIFLSLGKWIAAKALQNIHDMAKITEKITINQLSHRINYQDWPHELEDLGLSFNKMISGIELSFNRLNECTNELAHELRIPINNLIGSTEIILARERKKLEYKELLASNLEEFRRLSKLTEDILFLARSEAPHTSIILTKFSINREIEQLCGFYKYVVDEKNITLTYQGDACVRADSMLLRRAIINLLNNALKYTPRNGAISVSVAETNNYIEVRVADTGIGIGEEELNRIFERFYKGKQFFSESLNFGLGLPIVKSIMMLHKGYVTVASELNMGTTFTLHFPKVVN